MNSVMNSMMNSVMNSMMKSVMKRLSVLAAVVVFCVLLAFASTAGPTIAGTGGTAGSCLAPTVCWSSPGNVTANDGTFATAALNAGGGSNELQGTNFGFTVPAGSTINGITVEINKKAISGIGNPTDVDVTLLKAGAATGSNLGHTGAGNGWLSAGATDTYGGTSNLWGTTWTPADVNASNFGVQISCVEWTTGGGATAGVDFIRITVTFTPPPGGKRRVIETQVRESGELVIG